MKFKLNLVIILFFIMIFQSNSFGQKNIDENFQIIYPEKKISHGTKSIQLNWKSNKVRQINIEYSINSRNWIEIVNDYSSFYESYSFAPPILKFDSLWIRVLDTKTNEVLDVIKLEHESINPFNVESKVNAAGTITLTAPSGGETFTAGSTPTISWVSSGVAYVKIEYSLNAGVNWANVQSSYLASLGSYSFWTVPDKPTTLLLIRISDTSDITIADTTSTYLSIKSPQFGISEVVKIMPLGNSITEGKYGGGVLPLADRVSYRKLVYDSLYTKSRFDFVGHSSSGSNILTDTDNVGLAGRTASDLRSLFQTGYDSYSTGTQVTTGPYLNTYPADIVLVHVGTNGLIPATTITELDDILTAIYTADPNSWVILSKIIDWVPSNSDVSDFNSRIDTIAWQRINNGDNLLLLDMQSGAGIDYTIDSSSPFNDGDMYNYLHPNSSGYDKMGELWFSALKLILPSQMAVAKVKILLGGTYDSVGDTLKTNLNDSSFIPTSQPYDGSPWNYSGSELVSSGFFSTNKNIVDWVNLELRTSTSSGSTVAKRAGFLTNDGSVIDTNGRSDIAFGDISAGSYYLVVKHRNHLAAMSSSTVSLDATTPSSFYDFTASQSSAYGTNPLYEIVSGVFGLYPGDVNHDNKVAYNGASNDKNAILSTVGFTTINNVLNGYYSDDVNMDGVVKYNGSSNDKNAILTIVGFLSINNIIFGQVP